MGVGGLQHLLNQIRSWNPLQLHSCVPDIGTLPVLRSRLDPGLLPVSTRRASKPHISLSTTIRFRLVLTLCGGRIHFDSPQSRLQTRHPFRLLNRARARLAQ